MPQHPPALPVVSGRARTAAHRAAEDNQRLISAVISRSLPSLYADPDRLADAYTAGYMGLLHAAERFDPARDRRFSTYATRCIHGSILRHLRTERVQTAIPTVSLGTPAGEDGCVGDLIAGPSAEVPGVALVASAGFAALTSRLADGRQRALLEALYGDGESLEEVSRRMGVTRQRGDQIHRQALGHLRASLGVKTRKKGTAVN